MDYDAVLEQDEALNDCYAEAHEYDQEQQALSLDPQFLEVTKEHILTRMYDEDAHEDEAFMEIVEIHKAKVTGAGWMTASHLDLTVKVSSGMVRRCHLHENYYHASRNWPEDYDFSIEWLD